MTPIAKALLLSVALVFTSVVASAVDAERLHDVRLPVVGAPCFTSAHKVKVVAESAADCPKQEKFEVATAAAAKEFALQPEQFEGLTVYYVAAKFVLPGVPPVTAWGVAEPWKAKAYVSTVSPFDRHSITHHELRHVAAFLRYVIDQECIDQDPFGLADCEGGKK